MTLADVVQIHPKDFSKPSARAIEDRINAKYADKVLHKVGLCVGFHSLISASEGLIGQTGSGIVNVNVDFRLVVFRPFKGEILQGTITYSEPRGIHLSMGFFDDVVVPPSVLFDPSVYQKEETSEQHVWVWKNWQDDPAGEETNTETGKPGTMLEYYYDRAEKCFFRVEREEWQDLSPQKAKPRGYVDDDETNGHMPERAAPYSIHASMMHTGLGPKLWWIGEEELAEAQQEDGVDGADGAEQDMNGA